MAREGGRLLRDARYGRVMLMLLRNFSNEYAFLLTLRPSLEHASAHRSKTDFRGHCRCFALETPSAKATDSILPEFRLRTKPFIAMSSCFMLIPIDLKSA